MIRWISAACLSLTVMGCSSPEPVVSENVTANVADDGQNYSAVVAGLDPAARKGVLFRAIRDAGLTCQQVTEVDDQPPINGAPVWRARCDNGNYHLVQVTPDGTATVISRPGN